MHLRENQFKILGTDAFLNAESGIDAKFEAVFGASWVPLLLPVNKGYWLSMVELEPVGKLGYIDMASAR